MRTSLATSLVLLSLVAAAASARAEARHAALGPDGEVYLLQAGSYGTLFPDGKGIDPDNTVLALDVVQPQKGTLRLLVPGTDGSDVEGSPSVLYEDSSHTAYLVWESRFNYIHSRINLVSYDGSSWSDPIELSGAVFSFKSAPKIAITRGSYHTTDDAGDTVTHSRTILHTVWWEDAASGEHAVYSPVILADGAYVGTNQVYALSDFQQGAPGDPGPVAPAAEGLMRAPSIQPGSDSSSVVVAFVDPPTGRLVTLDVHVVAGELTDLADQVRGHIVDIGAHHAVRDLASLAADVRGHIVDIGAHLNQDIVQAIAVDVQDQIGKLGSAFAAGDFVGLGEAVRGHIVDIGSRLAGRGLQRATAAELAQPPMVVEVDGAPVDGSAPLGRPSDFLQIRQASARLTPQTDDAPTTVFMSETGERSLVVWQGASALQYRETRGADWSEIHTLDLGDSLDLDRAYDLLEHRLRSR